jgi:hypothetical protein
VQTSDAQPDEAGSKPIPVEETAKSHRAFSRLKRELSDEELSSPGVQKLLLDYLAQADNEIAALKAFREQFHEADKRNGVLEEKLKINSAAEVISMGSLAVGAAALGYAPSLWSSTTHSGPIALAFGIVLIIVGILAKVIRR